MNKLLPKLKRHLERNGVETGLYTLKWFFQCFLDRVSSISRIMNILKYIFIYKHKICNIIFRYHSS